ncbi:ribonuclease P protein subunit p25-like protein [Cylas formicarius]|uniref:ribonuclease P protein subunit p25-like protein n=1 Tax=Cylas formicarius TaxID=197179 RepID=UPI0029586DCB|nr:ribonuclease P protein subunit p25-like protein [Cylas formicarius]
MDNYRKGKNAEEPLERNKLPFFNLPEKFLWMQVRGGTKIRNVLNFALEKFAETQCIVWTGFGPSIGKTITCAEIMKREYGNSLYQVTKLSYRSVEEFWDPILPELDQLVVKRQIPMIHILLTKNLVSKEESGYQQSTTVSPFTKKIKN